MPLEDLALDLVESDAPDARGGAGEVPVYELLVQADGLEDLGPAVENSVEMPILEMTLRRPLPMALT